MNPEISPPARVAATPPHQAQQHQHRLNHTRALREERGGGERSAGTNTPTMAQAQTSSPTRRTPAALDAGSTTASASGRTQPDLQHYGGSGLPHLATGNSTVWNSTTGAFLVSDAVGMQRLSLDKAVAPLLKAPVAPFAKKNERKRALLNASYYSECFLNSIGPLDADSAALDAQHRYDKWWVEAKYRGGGGEDGGDGDGDSSSVPGTKKRRVSSSDTSNSPIEPAEGRTSLAADEERKCERRTGPCVIVDDDQSLSSLLPQSLKNPPNVVTNDPSLPLKAALVADLQATGGDVTTPVVLSCLGQLHALYCERMCDARWSRRSETFDGDGTWLTLSKPTFSECLGRNAQGRNLYTLGRLSFDMFRPTQLKCSVNGIFNSVSLASANSDDDEAARPRSYPRRFQKTLQSSSGKDNSPAVRNYDISVAFTIEAHQTRRGRTVEGLKADDEEYVVRKPIRGLLTNQGYMIPDPHTPNRLSIWFSGGSLEVQEDSDLNEWKHLFNEDEAPRRDLGEYARVLAAKFLLGASSDETLADDGSMSYRLNRPIGGHGQVFCDVLYSDVDLRVIRGHHGTIFVHTRVPTAHIQTQS